MFQIYPDACASSWIFLEILERFHGSVRTRQNSTEGLAMSFPVTMCRRPDDLDFSEFMSKEEQRLSLQREKQRQEEETRRLAEEKKLAEEVEAEKLQLLREKASVY
jgi:hypothetical protein